MKRFRLILVPQEIKIHAPYGIVTEGTTKVEFSKIVAALESINGIKKNIQYKAWPTFDDECYYVYEGEDYILKFEINGGFKKLPPDRCSEISIKTYPHVPSKKNFIEILEVINKIQARLNFKIYSVEYHKVVSLEELKEKINEIDY